MWRLSLKRKSLTLICLCVLCSFLFITFYNLLINFRDVGSTDCPEDILTFKDNGNIATQLWSYVSVWALAKSNSRWHPYAPKSTLTRIETIFISSGINFNEYGTLTNDCLHRVYSKGGPLEYPGDRVLNFQYVPEMYAEVVFALKIELKKEFIFRSESIIYTNNLIEYGKDYMEQQGLITDTFVAVLVSSRMKSDRDVFNYYESSMNWFRKELRNPLFFIIEYRSSDDNGQFLHEKDVVNVRNKSYGYILSLIARCNNLIIDEGAMAVFSALFAHGYVHIYNPGRLANIDTNLTNWIVYKTRSR